MTPVVAHGAGSGIPRFACATAAAGKIVLQANAAMVAAASWVAM
jgi:hypothetical protein